MPTFTASQVSTMQGYLSAAQGYLQAGNTSAALNSIATYYSYQSSLLGGQGYASIAAQVVTNTGTYGKVANQLLINALGQSQYDSIKANLAYSLANDDLNDIKGNGNNVATISQVEANHMTEFEIFKIPIDAWGGTAFAALGGNWTNGAATTAEQPNVHDDPDFANPNIISGDQVGNAIGNLYRAGSDLGFPGSIGEFLDDFGGLFQLFNLQQQWLQQYVPGVQPFSITMNPDGTFNVFKTNTGPWAGEPWLSQSDDLTAQGQLTAQKTQVNLGSYQEAFYDQNSGSLVQLVSDTSTGKTVSDINSSGVTYDIAQYNTQDILQSQTITNSDNSKDIWTYDTGNPNVTSYAVNLSPQGQEAWQFDWNNNPATPFTIWQPNTTGSGNWLSRTVNFDSTMQAQTAVTNLNTGDWSEIWWNPGSANWTSATIQYQGSSGNWEWQLFGYAPGNSVSYLNDLSGNTSPTNWSYIVNERDANNNVTATGTVDYNGNQVWSSYNPSDPGYQWQSYYQGGALSQVAIENADGSSTQIYYDIYGQSWQTDTQTFASGSAQTSDVWRNNDGSFSATYLNYNNSASWSKYTDYYNSAGQLTTQVTNQLNGAQVVQDYQPGTTNPDYVQVNIPAGLKSEEWISGGQTVDEQFNPADRLPFDQQTNFYQGDQLARSLTVGQDGTVDQNWNLSGSGTWNEQDFSYDKNGIETFIKTVLNGGTVEDEAFISSNDTIIEVFSPSGNFQSGTQDYEGNIYPLSGVAAAGFDGIFQDSAGYDDPYGVGGGPVGTDGFTDLGGVDDGEPGVGDIGGAGDSGATDDGGDIDPIVLKLQPGAVSTVARITSGVSFDMLNQGTAVPTGWITSGEGFLVFDPAGAAITGAGQLIPSMAALAGYDANGDGTIDDRDPSFAGLRVWIPGAGGQGGSLDTLAQLGIAAISTAGTPDGAFDQGNQILSSFQVTFTDGATGSGAEVAFALGPNATNNNGVASPAPAPVRGSLDISNANTVVTVSSNSTITGGDGWDTVLGTAANNDTIALGNGFDHVSLAGNNNSVAIGNGGDSVTLSGNNDALQLGSGRNAIVLDGNNDAIRVGAGTDDITVGPSSGNNDSFTLDGAIASLVLQGAQNPIVFLNGGSAAITADPSGADHLTLHIGSAGGAATMANFATASDMLDLAPGLGFTTAEDAAAFANAHPDGAGGSLLIFAGGSVDFAGLAPGSLRAANFQIG